MKKVLRWIILIWSIIAIPYTLGSETDIVFYGLLYLGLIIGLMISDLRK